MSKSTQQTIIFKGGIFKETITFTVDEYDDIVIFKSDTFNWADFNSKSSYKRYKEDSIERLGVFLKIHRKEIDPNASKIGIDKTLVTSARELGYIRKKIGWVKSVPTLYDIYRIELYAHIKRLIYLKNQADDKLKEEQILLESQRMVDSLNKQNDNTVKNQGNVKITEEAIFLFNKIIDGGNIGKIQSTHELLTKLCFS